MATTMRNPSTTPSPPERRRGRTGLLVAVFALIVAVGAAVITIAGRDDDGPSGTPDPKPSAAPPVPDGLKVGDATATFDLATREVGGVPRGFPQTVAGAVEASAASVEATRTAGYDLTQVDRAAIQKEFGYDKYADIDELMAKAQEREGLDVDGRPVDAQPGDRYYNECLPQYGMYRVLNGDARETGKERPVPARPTDVWVLIWEPCVEGIGSPDHIDDLRVKWNVYLRRWKWENEDWRAVDEKWEWPDEEIPTPKDLMRPNVSLDERAELFRDAPGWQLFRGYSEAWPTDLLGTEPSA